MATIGNLSDECSKALQAELAPNDLLVIWKPTKSAIIVDGCDVPGKVAISLRVLAQAFDERHKQLIVDQLSEGLLEDPAVQAAIGGTVEAMARNNAQLIG